MSGLEMLRRRRLEDDVAAVVVLSARSEEEDRLLGLETGADDYVVKPFSPREVVLRVQALVRRGQPLGCGATLPTTLNAGALRMELVGRSAELAGESLPLTHREFDLLAFLAANPGAAFTKDQIMRRVWGWGPGTPRR